MGSAAAPQGGVWGHELALVGHQPAAARGSRVPDRLRRVRLALPEEPDGHVAGGGAGGPRRMERGACRRARRRRPGDQAAVLRPQVRRPGGAGAGLDHLRAPVRRAPAAAEPGAAGAAGGGAAGGPGGAGDPLDAPPVPHLPAVAGARRCTDRAVRAAVLGPFRLLQRGAFAVPFTLTSRPYRRQNALLLGSLALPLVAHLLTTLNVVPFGRVDLTRFAFLLTVVFMVLAVFRFHLLDLRPIARSRIFQTIGEGVVVLDLGGKVIDANVAAERLLGLPLARIVGQPARRVLPAWAGVVQDQLALGDGEAIEEIEMGTSTHEVTVSSLTDHLGWPTGQLVVARDVTERRRVEQQLRDSLEREQASTRHLRALDQMKSTFLQAVSHDLRTPLASVLGIAITLQRRHLELGRDDVADLLHRLSRSARKMDRLLNDLLDLDRLAQPTVSPERERVALGELVERVVKDASAELLEHRPVHVAVCPLRLEVDPPKVERIVENLLANAARHTPPGTPVWVRVEQHGNGALLVVDDAGPGVPPQLRETIFQPFRQGPRPASHAPGLGVGLALVRVFAQLHGGSAWVEDRPGGRGASFRVHLPDPGYSTG